ncbi:unnamed protein product [Oikopleura dioica]|uniref:Uncharacterized protein n=1 Tax=Oikopleura dioica TaxID=34765 RepID=E4X0P3_OIKDI|nr:unnamed protein product [Oikopleura dioica]CBY33685.1 unnamed protein product [Oikopleura dioica]
MIEHNLEISTTSSFLCRFKSTEIAAWILYSLGFLAIVTSRTKRGFLNRTSFILLIVNDVCLSLGMGQWVLLAYFWFSSWAQLTGLWMTTALSASICAVNLFFLLRPGF